MSSDICKDIEIFDDRIVSINSIQLDKMGCVSYHVKFCRSLETNSSSLRSVLNQIQTNIFRDI